MDGTPQVLIINCAMRLYLIAAAVADSSALFIDLDHLHRTLWP